MGIAISDDHLELSSVAEAFLGRTGALAEARSLLDAAEESLPAAWKEMADLGWLGLHLPEAHMTVDGQPVPGQCGSQPRKQGLMILDPVQRRVR